MQTSKIWGILEYDVLPFPCFAFSFLKNYAPHFSSPSYALSHYYLLSSYFLTDDGIRENFIQDPSIVCNAVNLPYLSTITPKKECNSPIETYGHICFVPGSKCCHDCHSNISFIECLLMKNINIALVRQSAPTSKPMSEISFRWYIKILKLKWIHHFSIWSKCLNHTLVSGNASSSVIICQTNCYSILILKCLT